jgi:hypothetical protein
MKFRSPRAIERENSIAPDSDEFEALYADFVKWRTTIPGTRTLFSQEEISRSFEAIGQMLSDPDVARFFRVKPHQEPIIARAAEVLEKQQGRFIHDIYGLFQRAIEIQNAAHRKQRLRSIGEVLSEAELRKRQSVTPTEAAAALCYRDARSIRSLREKSKLTPTSKGRIVIDDKFWSLYRKAHKPTVG